MLAKSHRMARRSLDETGRASSRVPPIGLTNQTLVSSAAEQELGVCDRAVFCGRDLGKSLGLPARPLLLAWNSFGGSHCLASSETIFLETIRTRRQGDGESDESESDTNKPRRLECRQSCWTI